MNPVSTWGGTMVATKGEILNFSTLKSPENAFSGIFTYLILVLKYYNFAIFQHILCKTYNESLQKQAEAKFDLLLTWIYNVFGQCIGNSCYAVKTPKDEITCATYWNFYKKLKLWTCFPQNRRFRDQTGGREIISQNGRVWNICIAH